MFEFTAGLAAGLMIAGILAMALQIQQRRSRPEPEEIEVLVEGGLPLATIEEVTAATDSSRAVTPIGLEPVKELEVAVTDWGEDFTGEGDVLPRWRWGVYDYDHTMKVALSGHDDIGINVPYMIGNSPTLDEAIEAANAWACDTYGKGRYSLTTLPATVAAGE